MSNERVEFLGEIESRLSNLPDSEVEKIISYYNESIEDRLDDGMTEEDAVKSLGTVDSIVIGIQEEISFNDVVKEKISNSDKVVLVNGDSVSEINLDNKRVEYTLDGDYAEIHFDTDNRGVEVRKSVDEHVHLVVYQNKYEYYEITENENLTVKYVEEKSFFGRRISFLNKNKQKAELYIPQNESQKLFVNGKNDDVDVSEIKLNSVNLSNKNGKIIFGGSIVKNCVVENKNGGIEISRVISNDIKVDNKNGNIQVNNTMSENFINGTNKNGNIKFINVKCNDIKTDSKNGNIEIDNTIANNFIDCINMNGNIVIKNVNGDNIKLNNKSGSIIISATHSNNDIEVSNASGGIRFDNISFGRLIAKCSNGSVRGDIEGAEKDYIFDMTATNGIVRLNGKKIKSIVGSGSKLVKINCSNGSVKVSTK